MSTSVANPVAPSKVPQTAADLEHVDVQFSLSKLWENYRELAKPKIALMVLFSMGVGYLLGSAGEWTLWPLLNASVGVFLAVVASSCFNQAIEATTDSRMARTKNRPIPAGKLTVQQVYLIAIVCSVSSFLYLVLTVNMLTAVLTLGTTVLYAGLYTPLKRYSVLCTAVGAIPGAAPPVLGWVAAGGQLNMVAFSLFAILFVWQFPHFLAIAWMYRDEYLRAGLKMVPGSGREQMVGRVAFAYSLVLIPISLLPRHYGLAGDFYAVVALILGFIYARSSWKFAKDESRQQARRVLFASLFYLPGVLLALAFDHLRLLS
ncbi:Protoheme IX farnesyltransferase 1 [Thalassoglobus neptunius]|uniref:Protoheme IX farnesyltransferase n=1 Tax=Thalassoglobus neptunius TaxID=1938619 RepID=A0A5C5X409_9PLAN|nr:heme o synthase [Thalassoglobus neptunius]TWT57319.1 Protoheme IX farnesyltransferase 1 [Thalassoglobus neptunius]